MNLKVEVIDNAHHPYEARNVTLDEPEPAAKLIPILEKLNQEKGRRVMEKMANRQAPVENSFSQAMEEMPGHCRGSLGSPTLIKFRNMLEAMFEELAGAPKIWTNEADVITQT